MMKKLLSLAVMAMCVTLSVFAEATINIDDVTKVKVIDPSYQYMDLGEGVCTVPAGEYLVTPALENYAINKVELNGVEVYESFGYYYVTLADDDVLNIYALYDAETYTVTLNAEEGVISYAKAADDEIANFNEPFQVPAGYTLYLTPNAAMYNISSVLVNGLDTYYYAGTISVVIKGETTIDVTSSPKELNDITVNVNYPQGVQLYGAVSNMYYDANVPITVTETENAVKISEEFSYLAVCKAPGYYVTSVTVDGQNVEQSWSVFYAPIQKGSVVDIVCEEIVLDQTATVVVKDKDAAVNYFAFATVDYETIELEEGVNTLKFSAGYNPFSFSCYGESIATVIYLNGESIDPEYEGGTYFDGICLKDGDYLEIFILGGESEYQGSGISTIGADAHDVIYTLDGKRVNELMKGFNVVNGRKVMVK